ncbi:hypothetical protein QZH41_007672 [Actinostola sp. cb2023]|nr:hypothetical protein QZH41_007672 [Actinostola sp. cb2023]
MVVFIIIIFAGSPDKDRKSRVIYPDEKAVDRDVESNSKGQVFEQKIERSISKKRTFMFIMILTAPKGTEKRDAIRNTWLKIDNVDFMAKFIIGGKSLTKSERHNLESENQNYKDIVIIPDLKDGYHELSNKVLHGFKWIDENIDCSYVFKADDDSFVRIDMIVSELEGHSKSKTPNLYWGFFRGNANVKRRGKWAESKWVLCDHYLPYANGGGYVLSTTLVNFIARNWDLLQQYNSEDVSVVEGASKRKKIDSLSLDPENAGKHFVVKIKGRKRGCVQCKKNGSTTPKGRTIESTFECLQCGVALCKMDCFRDYHQG